METQDCKRAQRAYERVISRVDFENSDKYKSFALSFPALIHSVGLAQAIAYAQAKSLPEYQADLAYVVGMETMDVLAKESRLAHLSEYRRLTFEVINCASWIKRYVEAFFKKKDNQESPNGEPSV
ncbi:MAG: CRISPR-associated protein Cmr5 [Thermodesulfobacteria bacterium]|nr:CRISPR-associated protein Cmr5 [Thermodesulfobacteriota bacterium]